MLSTTELIETYKRHPFTDGLLPFMAALKALTTPFPRIYAKNEGQQRWVFYDKKTKQPALFSHVAVVIASDNQETGNYVPEGQEVPFGVEGKTVQKRANSKCFYTYIFDTYTDMSLYEGQWILDDHMRTLKDFNPDNLPRRAYLSGNDPKYRNRFWMQTPMFIRRGPKETRGPAPTHVHPWVIRADEESKGFRANPDRPRVWVRIRNDIMPISEQVPNTVQWGNVVAISFTVTYHSTSTNWFAQFHPADIIVLKAGDADGTDYSAPMLELHNRPPPSFDARLVQDTNFEIGEYNEGEDNIGDEGGYAEGPVLEEMIVDGTEGDDEGSEGETMEVDDGMQHGLMDGLAGLGEVLPAGEDADGYDLVEEPDEEKEVSAEDFVDIMAEDVNGDRRATRAVTRGARTGRKRN